MYQDTATWTSPSGVVVRFKVPTASRDMLAFEHTLQTRLAPLYQDTATPVYTPPTDIVYACAEWLRGLVISHADTDQLFKWSLGPDSVVALAIHAFNTGSLGEEALENISLATRVSAKGGCECRICTGRLTDEPTPEQRATCLYAGVSDATHYRIAAAAPFLDSPSMECPWWVFETVRAIKAEGAKVARERERSQQRKREIDKRLGSRA